MVRQVTVYRSHTQDGHSSSRFKAAAVAKGNILVFVDTTAVVNHGWIQPLIAKLLDEPSLIAVPHYDDWMPDDRLVSRQLSAFISRRRPPTFWPLRAAPCLAHPLLSTFVHQRLHVLLSSGFH